MTTDPWQIIEQQRQEIHQLKNTLRAILDDYDRRMATRRGRFQVWLARKTRPARKQREEKAA